MDNNSALRHSFAAACMGATVVALAAGGAETTKHSPDWSHPVVQGHGKVVKMLEAVEQPRDGSKIVVDLTAGGDPAEVNPGLAKVARFVNIYGGAGAEAASCEITVVAHGKATVVTLADEPYSVATGAGSNPNRDLIKRLQKAGVELLVCGQALAHQGHRGDEVVPEFEVAVSALTANVNRQADGYARIPLN
ncbi:DsrE/DsrF-like family protein [Maioricimonas rarisocia]|uniref:DsrE/DsrF-like family protein n=1 Tax=Maioricimonas rarisocia TaxID=2528026 RepID=A0A517ZA34_9PLAN|nr:DsrE family protein [Maioricimonas rarisocia]QDU39352.1 DsrE/DsrF-like family protein [Maioricimonas rarisocia]